MSTFKERLIAGATIVGAAVTCIAVGYSIGKDTNDGLLNFLREKNQTVENSETQLRAEVSSLKLELQSTKNVNATGTASLSGSAGAAASGAGSISSKALAAFDSVRVVLQTQSSVSLFGGQVVVSLVGISFEGDPLRHKVIATIGAPGKVNRTLDKVDVGFATVFEGYEVRLVASDTFSATFVVTRV